MIPKDKEEKLDSFLNDENNLENENIEKQNNTKIISDKSIVERINKKVITEDGRELLI